MNDTRLIDKATDEIVRNFILSPEPSVLCISGDWGVGKSYHWNWTLKSLQKKIPRNFENYSYVSLYGEGQLDNIKSSIFYERAPLKGTKNLFDFNATTRVSRLARDIKKIASKNPILNDSFLLSTCQNHFICFDDLERMTKSIRIDEFMGLCSQLKEQKSCKIAIIANTSRFEDEKRCREFAAQLDKSVDYTVHFSPTNEQILKIGLPESTAHRTLISEFVSQLKIRNIRTIERLRSFVEKNVCLLEQYDDRIVRHFLHSSTLFFFAKFEPHKAPSLEYLRSYNPFMARRDENEKSKQENWRQALADYGFVAVDELDQVLIEAIESGWLDTERLTGCADKLQAKVVNQDAQDRSLQAWSRMFESFDDNQNELLEDIERTFINNIQQESPSAVSQTVALFKRLGRPEKAKELLKRFVEDREAGHGFWTLEDYGFPTHVQDDDVREAFRAKAEVEKPAPESPAEVLLRISKNSGWNPSDIETLSALSVDQFETIFRAFSGPDLGKLIREALQFEHRGAEGSDERKIADNAGLALERISGTSELNAYRIGIFMSS